SQTHALQERLIVSGHNRYTTFNTHQNDGPTPYDDLFYGAHMVTRRWLASVEARTSAGGQTGWPTPGGRLEVNNVFHAGAADLLSRWRLQEGTLPYGAVQADPSLIPEEGIGEVDIEYDTFYGNGEGMALPIVSASLSGSTITEGGSVTLSLAASDPDGHA